MSEGEVRVLYMEQAQKMKAAGSLLEAEKLYLQVGEVTAKRMGGGREVGTFGGGLNAKQRHAHEAVLAKLH